jgi:hypothetical protein
VRVALATTVLVLAVGAAGFAGLAQAASHNPTKAQISKAIKNAESSTSLWATVNLCDTKRHRYTIGVRGQMPALGFPAWLSMRIQLNQYETKKRKFVPLSNATALVRLGRVSRGLQQAGEQWTYSAHAGLFNARIQFIWRRSGKLLGQTSRRTTAGHPGADFGEPAHFSAKQCRIR